MNEYIRDEVLKCQGPITDDWYDHEIEEHEEEGGGGEESGDDEDDDDDISDLLWQVHHEWLHYESDDFMHLVMVRFLSPQCDDMMFRLWGWSTRASYGFVLSVYEPRCKLSCSVSRFEVTFKHGFEGFTSKTIGDSLNNDTPETYMWEVQDLENDRGLASLPKAHRLYSKSTPHILLCVLL